MNTTEKRLKRLLQTLASILLVGPGMLMLFAFQDRPSISDFAYAVNPSPFYTLIIGAAVLFIFNGYVYREKFGYNLILGFALLMVAMFGYREWPILHFSAAAIFFIFSCVSMILFSDPQLRMYKISFVAVIIMALIIHFVTGFISLFVAEWIGLLPICIHFITETRIKLKN